MNKVNGIDGTNFVSGTKYEKDRSDFEDKIDKIEKKIPDISDLVKKSALTAVENKIPDVSTLVKKTDYDAKISGLATNSSLTAVENKIPDITSLITKTDFDAKLKAISNRVTKNKSKDLLLDKELKKLKAFDTDYFEGKSYFEGDDGTQNTLVFQVKSISFKQKSLGNTKYNTWKSKGISDRSLYFANSDITTKLIRPFHVVLGTKIL